MDEYRDQAVEDAVHQATMNEYLAKKANDALKAQLIRNDFKASVVNNVAMDKIDDVVLDKIVDAQLVPSHSSLHLRYRPRDTTPHLALYLSLSQCVGRTPGRALCANNRVLSG
jgi:hypothetical protein